MLSWSRGRGFAVTLAMAIFDAASLWKRAVELRRVLSGITDRRAAEALEEHIARLEEEASRRDRHLSGDSPAKAGSGGATFVTTATTDATHRDA